TTALHSLAPIFVAVVVVPALVSFLQVGALVSGGPVSPNLERLDPVAGLKRLFSGNSLLEGVKSAVKLVLLSALVYAVARHTGGTRSTQTSPPPRREAPINEGRGRAREKEERGLPAAPRPPAAAAPRGPDAVDARRSAQGDRHRSQSRARRRGSRLREGRE